MGRAKKTFAATLWSPGATESYCFWSICLSNFFACFLEVFVSALSMVSVSFVSVFLSGAFSTFFCSRKGQGVENQQNSIS